MESTKGYVCLFSLTVCVSFFRQREKALYFFGLREMEKMATAAKLDKTEL